MEIKINKNNRYYRCLSFFFVIIFMLPVYSSEFATGKSKPNDLYQHASPYLAMHGKDPVQWREWNAQTIALAKKENKLLFVSSGYFSCHWCHVMQRESYQNTEVAKLINENFIPVKVDRELNSALDSHLIDFVESTQGSAGWPLNVFVTPDGYPLVGMVYVPTENFKQILMAMNQEWSNNQKQLEDLAKQASVALAQIEVSNSAELMPGLATAFKQVFLRQIFQISDDLQGGFGQQNKFPQVPQLMALLDIYSEAPNPEMAKFLQLTLDQMASLGLRDQLNGGFYRYSVDPGWHIPHFEKMLYDNALLIVVYLRAAKIFKREDYKNVAVNTLNFVMRDMPSSSSLFIASLSAVDKDGIEGGYYLWDEGQLKKILSNNEFKVVKVFWDINGAADLEHGHHLIEVASIDDVAKETGLSRKKVRQYIESARKKMIAVRNKRSVPPDTKQLTAWNGLMLTAMVMAYEQTNEQRFYTQAEKMVASIHSQLWTKDGLKRFIKDNKALGRGELEDYAFISEGLYQWWRVSKHDKDKALLLDILNYAWPHFYGEQGWLLAEDMLLKYSEGESLLSDGPMPSPAAVLIKISYDFSVDTDNLTLKNNALRALNVGQDTIMYEPFFYATQIRAVMHVQSNNKIK